MKQVIGLITGGAEGAGDAQDPRLVVGSRVRTEGGNNDYYSTTRSARPESAGHGGHVRARPRDRISTRARWRWRDRARPRRDPRCPDSRMTPVARRHRPLRPD